MKQRSLIFLILIPISISSAIGQNYKLGVGSTAPELRVKEWIKGKPVTRFEAGKFYFIETSATWCAPCRVEIPHMSELAEKYKGRLEVISVYTLESKAPDRIKKFITSMSDKISYSVAIDLPDDEVYKRWVKASGGDGLPNSFLVDGDGRIIWLGHPATADKILEAAFSGSIVEARNNQVREAKSSQLSYDRIFKLKAAGDLNSAVEKMDSLIMVYPNTASLYNMKFILLAGADDEKAYDCLQWILDNRGVDDFDWYHLIFNYETAKKPNWHIAHQIADRAIRQATIDSYLAAAMREKARMYYYQGDRDNAITWATKALEIARKEFKTPDLIEPFESVLKQCQGEPYKWVN